MAQIAIQAGCHTGFLARCEAASIRCAIPGSQLQAKMTLMRQSVAAMMPGAGCPKWAAEDPMAGPNHHAGRRGRGEPAERARPIRGSDGIGHIRLRHAGRSPARALHQAGEEEQPHAVGETEHQVGQGRRAQADEQRRPAAIAVGDPAPERRRHQLGDGDTRR